MASMIGSSDTRGPATVAGLRVSAVSKTFPGTHALEDVSFAIARGTIHALMGGNGSGKSTLIKILAGVMVGDRGGVIALGEREIASDRISPAWSAQAGLRVVHQDLGLFDDLSVVENLLAGQPPPRRFGRIDWRLARREAQSDLDRRGIAVRAGDTLGALRASDRTLVAIVRALRDHGGAPPPVLVLDEPTARLPPTEVAALIDALRRYAEQGSTILYVSHRLEEVLDLASEVTILRDGRVVQTCPVNGLSEPKLVELMVGRSSRLDASRPTRSVGAPVLTVSGLSAGPLTGLDLTVNAGEVVGVAGLVGSGRTHLLEAIFGRRPRSTGAVELAGALLEGSDVSASIGRGIAFVPEDRLRDGVFLNLGIPENVSASDPGRYSRKLLFRHRAERADAGIAVARFGIRTASVTAPLYTLSGGNQQKVLIARALTVAPRLLLLDEPTQGVDVAARAEIHSQIDGAVADGLAVLLVSSDLDELVRLADRVIVLAGGRITDESAGAVIDRRWLAQHMHVSAPAGLAA
jgi:ribose transport system ATP-binding protein